MLQEAIDYTVSSITAVWPQACIIVVLTIIAMPIVYKIGQRLENRKINN